MSTITFRVYGIPQTKGSTKAFMVKGMKHPIITNMNTKNKGWAAVVSGEAQKHAPADGLWDGPLAVSLVFYFMPPKALLKREKYKTVYPAKQPDLDKAVRSVNDALTGVIFTDDKLIVKSDEEKLYSLSPGVNITIRTLESPQGGSLL